MDSRQLKMTDDRLRKLSTTQRKETTQNTAEQNYPGSVDFYHTRPGNEVGLFYSSRVHMGSMQQQRQRQVDKTVVPSDQMSAFMSYGVSFSVSHATTSGAILHTSHHMLLTGSAVDWKLMLIVSPTNCTTT